MLKNAHKDPLLNKLYQLVYEYKHEPNSWNGEEQVNKIVQYLQNTEEGSQMVARTQEYIKAKFGNRILIYRGGENVATESNAGWSTDWNVALNFAGSKGENGELVVASVHPSQILFHDDVFDNKIKGYISEDEVILTEIGVAQYVGCVDVGTYESQIDDDETYNQLGYCSYEVEYLCKNALLKILIDKGYENPIL